MSPAPPTTPRKEEKHSCRGKEGNEGKVWQKCWENRLSFELARGLPAEIIVSKIQQIELSLTFHLGKMKPEIKLPRVNSSKFSLGK